MFTQMVSDLKEGIIPEDFPLRRRFETAIIKKIGVIRTPYSFWPSDRKINPPTKELLWAAILLEDKENYRMLEAIISSELEEKQKVKGIHDDIETLSNKVRLFMQDCIDEFLGLAPSATFKKILQHKLQTISQ